MLPYFGHISAFFAIIVGAAIFFDTVGAVRGNSKLAQLLLKGPSTLNEATAAAVKTTDSLFKLLFGTQGKWVRLARVTLFSALAFVVFYAFALITMAQNTPMAAEQINVFGTNGPRWEWFLVFFCINVLADFASFHQTRMIYRTLSDAAEINPVSPLRLALFVITDVFMSFVVTILVLGTLFGLGSYLFYKTTDNDAQVIFAHSAETPEHTLPVWYMSYDLDADIRNDLALLTKIEDGDDVTINTTTKNDISLWRDVAFWVVADPSVTNKADFLQNEISQDGLLCGPPAVALSDKTDRLAEIRFTLCTDAQNSLTHHLRFAFGKLLIGSGLSVQSGFAEYVAFAPLRRMVGVPQPIPVSNWLSDALIPAADKAMINERLRYLRFRESGHFSQQPVGTFILTAFCTTLISLFVIMTFAALAYVNTIRRLLQPINDEYLDVTKASFTISTLVAYLTVLAGSFLIAQIV